MPYSEAQRIVLTHRYRTELPFPVSTAFCRFVSPTKDRALKVVRLQQATESAIRYAAIIAVCDYASDPGRNSRTLQWLRELWLTKAGLAMGDWFAALEKLVAESGTFWKEPFVPEFARLNLGRLKKSFEAICQDRNIIQHGTIASGLTMQQFLLAHEEDVYVILDELQFLKDYPLCFAECEEDAEYLVPGVPQTLNLCHGTSRAFSQQFVVPSEPLPQGEPFIWRHDYGAILMLSPFFVYGRAPIATTAGAGKNARKSVTANLQGLLVLNGVKGARNYASMDQEAHFALDSFLFPSPDEIRRQLAASLAAGNADEARRRAIQLDARGKEQFKHKPGDLPDGYEIAGETGCYVVQGQPIGRGGMGVVYLAKRRSDAQEFAIKLMPLELMAIGSLVKRFEREGRMLMELSQGANPNIVRLIEMGRHESYHYLIMEYVEGGSLADELLHRVARQPPFSLGEAVEIVEQICNGLKAMHARGMIHRDLKPANILLARESSEGQTIAGLIPKITDLGLSRRIGQQSMALSMELGALGTYEYMPPEQFEDSGDQPITQRADIYTVGKILCQMLTGKVPRNAEEVDVLDFPETPADDEALKVKEPTGESAKSLPVNGIKGVLACCLAKQPGDRFESTEVFLDALRNAGRIDAAATSLDIFGVRRRDVRAAYGLARIGHQQASQRLAVWAKTPGDARRSEAAVAILCLRTGGLELLRRMAGQVMAGKDVSEPIAEGVKRLMECCLAGSVGDVDESLSSLGQLAEDSDGCKEGKATATLSTHELLHPAARAAFLLASLAIPAGVDNLVAFCQSEDADLRADAAVGLSRLGSEPVKVLCSRLESAWEESAESQQTVFLVHALSAALRWHEANLPQSGGPQWLRELAPDPRNGIKRAYACENLGHLKGSIFDILAGHLLTTAVVAGIGSLPLNFWQANILWRTHPEDAGLWARVSAFFFGSMLVGILWGCLFPGAAAVARQFHRPKRYLMLAATSGVAALLCTLGIMAFALSQAKGELAATATIAGTINLTYAMVSYFGFLSVLVSFAFFTYFLCKELPWFSRRLPMPFLSLIALPLWLTVVCALSVPVFWHSVFLPRELIGELGLAGAAGFGVGLADWLYDRQRLARRLAVRPPP